MQKTYNDLLNTKYDTEYISILLMVTRFVILDLTSKGQNHSWNGLEDDDEIGDKVQGL